MALQNPNTRKNLLMWGLYALLLFVTLLVQDVFLGKFTLLGIHLTLLPLLTCAAACHTDAGSGGVFGLCAGLLWALGGGADGGATLVCLTASGVLSGYLCDAVLHRRCLTGILCALLSLSVCGFGTLLMQFFLNDAGLWGLRLTLRQILLSLPLSPLFYWAAKIIRKAGPQHG